MERSPQAAGPWSNDIVRRLGAIVLALSALGVLWLAQWGDVDARIADLARLSEAGRASGALASGARALSALSAGAWPAIADVSLQIGCVALVCVAAWLLSRSRVVAAIAGALALAAPQPAQWLDRPLGFAEALTVAAMTVGFTIVLSRRHVPVLPAAAFAATALDGWPAAALLALAIGRARWGVAVAAACLAGIVLRFAVGVPAALVVGDFGAPGPRAVVAVRLAVAVLLALPAVIFVMTRPRLHGLVRDTRPEQAVALAALVLLVVGPILPFGAAATYCAVIAALLLFARLAVLVPRNRIRDGLVVAAAAALFVSGALGRVASHPADAIARIEQDRAALHAISGAPTFDLVDHGEPFFRRRYAPAIVHYLAGRDVAVRYVAVAPEKAAVPVLDASAAGLQRIDAAIDAVRSLRDARRHVAFEFTASGAGGEINDRTPQATASKQGVIPSIELAGPQGMLTSLIVLGHFSETFRHVRVRPGDRLVYAVAKVIPLGGPMRTTVSVEIPGGPTVTAVDRVEPPRTGAPLAWRFRSVSLPLVAPAEVVVRFAASSIGPNFGDWAAFAEPAIVSR